MKRAPEAIIVTPPFSPFDAGPPLGPAVLKSHLKDRGTTVRCVDLNIRYLGAVGPCGPYAGTVVGDHAKARDRVSAARRHFKAMLDLPVPEPDLVPCSVDPALALCYGFDVVSAAAERLSRNPFWQDLIEEHLFRLHAPVVLGLSIMGPAQVIPALALALEAKRRWPGTFVVAGGSHVTLLAERIREEPRYGGVIDGFLTGHAEVGLARLVTDLRCGATPRVLRAGYPERGESATLDPSEWPAPCFEADDLSLYPPERASLPLQLERGCGYGRCAFCTYPAVEERVAGATRVLAERFLRALAPLPWSRLSVKDSLMPLAAMRRFGEVVEQRATGCVWSATTKVTHGLAPSVLAELHGLGCRTLELGIETIHPRMQVLIRKVQSRTCIEEVVRAAVGAGIAVVVNLL